MCVCGQAMGLDSADARIRVNYEDFVKNRYPGGQYDNKGPPVEVKRRSIIIEDLVDFQRYRDDRSRNDKERTFLQNKITQEFMWREPDWDDVWMQRRKRSTVQGRVEEWQQLLDPSTGRSFEYNAITSVCRWKAF